MARASASPSRRTILRRTFAKLAHKGHAALEQIQISLGPASIQTTERYLGIEHRVDVAALSTA